MERKNQLGATQWFIELIVRSTCFMHHSTMHGPALIKSILIIARLCNDLASHNIEYV